MQVINGWVINSRLITQEATFQLRVGDHREECVADIINTGSYPCILGTLWLVRHDPTIQWSQKEVSFDLEYCKQNCLQHGVEVQEAKKNTREQKLKPLQLPKKKKMMG